MFTVAVSNARLLDVWLVLALFTYIKNKNKYKVSYKEVGVRSPNYMLFLDPNFPY
jgi:hypothetical protein